MWRCNCKIRLIAHVFLQMQVLKSLLPFQNLRAYLNFQKVYEGVHRYTKRPSKFPWILEVRIPDLH